MNLLEQAKSDGDTFHEHSDVHFRMSCDLMNEYLKPKRGESIIDFGCATGRLAVELASRVGKSGRVVGVDIDKRRIALARAELIRLHSSHVSLTFVQRSIKEAMRLEPFDRILNNMVFQWIKPVERSIIMKDIYSNLKPGGRFAFLVFPTQTQDRFIFRDILSLLSPSESLESVWGIYLESVSTWLQLCTDIGFDIEMSDVKMVEEEEPTVKDLVALVEAAVPAFKSYMLSEKDVEYLKQLYRSDSHEKIRYQCRVFTVLARKCL
ncbi:carboxy-S-adenosyl-L-methionine synthase-like [Corticium candelabrum]|uniref:carboxy-S-adenosyl-L-methionine synthase-like n=1 Tax=Corticium candelabrum TaxID=121492 RepID=UPI002E26CFE3|nr:carboxy-S-adenosyl-L-methionine synthase-like [Corticium candelabrum]